MDKTHYNCMTIGQLYGNIHDQNISTFKLLRGWEAVEEVNAGLFMREEGMDGWEVFGGIGTIDEEGKKIHQGRYREEYLSYRSDIDAEIV